AGAACEEHPRPGREQQPRAPDGRDLADLAGDLRLHAGPPWRGREQGLLPDAGGLADAAAGQAGTAVSFRNADSSASPGPPSSRSGPEKRISPAFKITTLSAIWAASPSTWLATTVVRP